MPSKTVLVIEDDRDLCNMIVHALQPFDCTPVVAEDGAQAMQLLSEICPHLIVLDLKLPFIHGEEILAHVRSQPEFADCKIIVVTVSNPTQTSALRRQVDYFFQKPYVLHDFRAVVETLLTLS